MKVGEWLRQAREESELSVGEVGVRSGLSEEVIRRAEAGGVTDAYHLCRLGPVLGLRDSDCMCFLEDRVPPDLYAMRGRVEVEQVERAFGELRRVLRGE